MKGLRLYKCERLCGVNAVDALFLHGGGERHSVMAYPWRCVWRVNEHRAGECARFLISVPKKRLKHAVDRVTMRRRCREAYRLNRHLFDAAESGVDMAFVYVGDKVSDYKTALNSMVKILTRIDTSLHEQA